jgi:hypothetical protein
LATSLPYSWAICLPPPMEADFSLNGPLIIFILNMFFIQSFRHVQPPFSEVSVKIPLPPRNQDQPRVETSFSLHRRWDISSHPEGLRNGCLLGFYLFYPLYQGCRYTHSLESDTATSLLGLPLCLPPFEDPSSRAPLGWAQGAS